MEMTTALAKQQKRAAPEDDDTVYIMPLGAAKEVGRSCIILKHKGRIIMLDCGIHPGRLGEDSLPFFDTGPDAKDIDLILISHFHLDHAASLPYFTERVNGGAFKGRIFATHPTKAIMRLMLQNHIRTDSVRMADGGDDQPLYTEAEMHACLDKIEVIDYHQVFEHKGVRFWCYNAGHVLGAAMFMVEIGGVRVLYTGDYSMEDDRHLMAAEIPDKYQPDILIVESTYGVQNHPPKEERENRFTDEVAKIVRRGGRCLLPVFALGRAQELMLILDEYWHANKDLHKTPIYFASYTAEKAHRVYETYVNMMNAHVRQQMDIANPFRFNYVRTLKSVHDLDDFQPSVVLASPGFLNSGPSRQLFDRWCSNEKNGVVLTGYSQEGTLARKLLQHPESVEDMRGNSQPLRASIESISFSAHVDFRQNQTFMREVKPTFIVLVHGETNQMNELKRALVRTIGASKDGQAGANIITPDLCADVQLTIPKRKTARLIGKLAERPVQPGEELDAVLVTKNFSTRLLDPSDLATYTQLRHRTLTQKLHFPFHQPASLLQVFLNELFDDIVIEAHSLAVTSEGGQPQPVDGPEPPQELSPATPAPATTTSFLINQSVRMVVDELAGKAWVEWEAGPVADMVADAAMALAIEAQTSPVALRLGSRPCCAHRKAPEVLHLDLHHHDDANAVSGDHGEVRTVEDEGGNGTDDGLEAVEDVEQGGEPPDPSAEPGSAPPAELTADVEEETPAEEEGVEAMEVAADIEADDGTSADPETLPLPATGAADEEDEPPGASVEPRLVTAEETKAAARRHRAQMKMLHRVFSSVYGRSAVSVDLSIYQVSVAVGGSEATVGLDGDELRVTCEDSSLHDQLSTIVGRVSAAVLW